MESSLKLLSPSFSWKKSHLKRKILLLGIIFQHIATCFFFHSSRTTSFTARMLGGQQCSTCLLRIPMCVIWVKIRNQTWSLTLFHLILLQKCNSGFQICPEQNLQILFFIKSNLVCCHGFSVWLCYVGSRNCTLIFEHVVEIFFFFGKNKPHSVRLYLIEL